MSETNQKPSEIGDSPTPTPFNVPPDFYDPVIEAYKKDVDRTLLRENLKPTVAERCRKFERNMRMINELRRAGKAKRNQAKE